MDDTNSTDSNTVEAAPERRHDELELPSCALCLEWVDPKQACVFWPASRVNAVCHVACYIAAGYDREAIAARAARSSS